MFQHVFEQYVAEKLFPGAFCVATIVAILLYIFLKLCLNSCFLFSVQMGRCRLSPL